MDKKWRAEDLQVIDPLSWLRGRPKFFFAGGTPNDDDLCAALVTDATAQGARCTVASWGNFWTVSSDADWLEHGQHSVRELFDRVVAAPQHGANSMRAEVLLHAFCADVATCGDGWVYVAGNVPEDLRRVVEADRSSARTVVFRLSPGGA